MHCTVSGCGTLLLQFMVHCCLLCCCLPFTSTQANAADLMMLSVWHATSALRCIHRRPIEITCRLQHLVAFHSFFFTSTAAGSSPASDLQSVQLLQVQPWLRCAALLNSGLGQQPCSTQHTAAYSQPNFTTALCLPAVQPLPSSCASLQRCMCLQCKLGGLSRSMLLKRAMPTHLPLRPMALPSAATRARDRTTRCMMLPRQLWELKQVRAGSLVQAAGPCLAQCCCCGMAEPPRWI